MKKLLHCLCITFIFAAAIHALAQEQKFPEYNFAITPPVEWKSVPIPPEAASTMLAAFKKQDGTQVILILKMPLPGKSIAVDDQFASESNRALNDLVGPGTRTGRFLEVDGLRAYELAGNVTAKGRTFSIMFRSVIANKIYYALEAMRFDGDAASSGEITKSLDSFHFLTRPTIVAADASTTNDTESGATHSLRYRVTYTTLNLLLVAGVAWFFVFLIRCINTPKPPPLPPTSQPPPPDAD